MGNLALMDKASNRRKRDETVAEYFARPVAKRGPKAAERSLIESFLFCAASDVAVPKKAGSNSLSLAAYEGFLRARWDRLRDGLYKALDI